MKYVREIGSAEAYLGQTGLELSPIRRIITFCHLKPVGPATGPWRLWEDGQGNFLRLTISRKIIGFFKGTKNITDILLRAPADTLKQKSSAMLRITVNDECYDWYLCEDRIRFRSTELSAEKVFCLGIKPIEKLLKQSETRAFLIKGFSAKFIEKKDYENHL